MKSCWNSEERRVMRRLSTPFRIQEYLDSLKYNTDDFVRSPREVMRKNRAHCFDGAIFGAAALECMGFPPLVVDMRSNEDDDDHVIAVFRRRKFWGAVAKSNYVGCRYRDAVYSSLRELIMSYFEVYFNLAGSKTLREYSVPFDLRRVRDIPWRTTDQDLDFLAARLDRTRHFRLLDKRMEGEISSVDQRSFQAGTFGLVRAGAFKVRSARLH